MPAIRVVAVASDFHRDEMIGAVHVRSGPTNEHGLPKPGELAQAIGGTAKVRGGIKVRGAGIVADPSRQKRLQSFPS
jgi:hypothetical protein